MQKIFYYLVNRCLNLLHSYNINQMNLPTKYKIKKPITIEAHKKIILGENIGINVNAILIGWGGIEIGENTLLGPNVQIYSITHDYTKFGEELYKGIPQKVVIGNNCWIGGGTLVMPGVNIGNNSVIGAGSVVTKDIPENVIAYGNPCKIIKKRFEV
ncbi:DapH/DapD/GlmU-related protein [Arcobacter arenosus]|nr:DapH/DapD/GlmU-related protein [Arcobacter arenosus]